MKLAISFLVRPSSVLQNDKFLFIQILEMMTMVLDGSKEDDEKWKRFSRQIVDVVFPQLPKLQVHIFMFKSW